MTKKLCLVLMFMALAGSHAGVRAQVDDICREFGVIPSLDMPWARVPYVYGKIVLNGFDSTAKPKVTVVLSERVNPSKKLTLSKTGSYCFRRSGSGGDIVIELDGIQVARRSLSSFGDGQQREDFDIYPNGTQPSVPPGTISAKFSHPRNEKTVELYQNAAKAQTAKDLAKAIDYLNQIVAIDPADFIAWSILGSLHTENKTFAEADAAFRKSLALKIDYTTAWINVGRLRVEQKQPEAAIEIFRHAASLDERNAGLYRLLARLCKKVTRYCGDGVTSNGEMCDAGMANSVTAYGRDQCTTTCKSAPFCGDGQPQPGQEECDEGPGNTLDDKTWSLQGGGCNRACKSISRRCGDGTLDMPEEQCDLGMSNTADELTYGSGPGCNKSCKKIGYCGDGNRDYLEFCDEGANNTKDDKTWGLKMGGCNRKCMVLVAYCGDGHIDVPDEQCDAGPGRNTGGPGGCNAQCKTVPP